MEVELGPAMEARKAKRQAKWGLSGGGGGKEKSRDLVDISTPAGEKVCRGTLGAEAVCYI